MFPFKVTAANTKLLILIWCQFELLQVIFQVKFVAGRAVNGKRKANLVCIHSRWALAYWLKWNSRRSQFMETFPCELWDCAYLLLHPPTLISVWSMGCRRMKYAYPAWACAQHMMLNTWISNHNCGSARKCTWSFVFRQRQAQGARRTHM